MIRVISGILSLTGLFWAYFAGVGVILSLIAPVAILRGDQIEPGWWYLFGQAYFGFFIWFGWIARALNFRYIVNRRIFWILSVIHHLIWLGPVFVTNDFGSDLMFELGLVVYLCLVVVLSSAFIFLDSDKTEQAGGVNECSAGAPHS